MGKRSREKREKRLRGDIKQKKEERDTGREKIFKKIIFFGTCLILFTPLVINNKFFFPFVGPKSLYFMGLVEIIFFAWLFLVFFSPKYRPRFNPILLALTLFLFVLIVSSIFGADFTNSFWSKFERMTGILMMLHLFAFFLVISSVFREKDWIEIFAISIFASIILSFIALTSKNPSMRGGATVGNSSFLGTYLLFNVFLALYLFLKSKGGLRVYSSISLVIISLALLLSDARAAIFSVSGGALLIFLFWLIFNKKGKLRLVGTSLLIVFAIGLLVLIYFFLQPDSFLYQKMSARYVVWEGAWKGFLERPWLGWGPENFEFVFAKYFNPCMFLPECGGEPWFDRAHNIVFDTLVQTGIIGFLSYLGIFGAIFWVLWKRYLKHGIGFWMSAIFSVMLISYFVQNLTVFDMVNSYMMFFLVLGFVGSFSVLREEIQPRAKTFSPNFWLGGIILILFIFSFFNFVINPFKTDYYTIQAFRYPDPNKRISLYKKSLETSPLGKYQIKTFFTEQFQNFYHSEAGKGTSKEDLKAELDFIISELKKSINESPLDFRSYLRLGQLYNSIIDLDRTRISEAEEILKNAIELSPTNQQAYWALIQTKVFQGDFKEALSLAEKAVELERRIDQSHLILIQVAKFKGDYDLAWEKAEEAIKIDPSWEPKIKEILGD